MLVEEKTQEKDGDILEDQSTKLKWLYWKA